MIYPDCHTMNVEDSHSLSLIVSDCVLQICVTEMFYHLCLKLMSSSVYKPRHSSVTSSSNRRRQNSYPSLSTVSRNSKAKPQPARRLASSSCSSEDDEEEQLLELPPRRSICSLVSKITVRNTGAAVDYFTRLTDLRMSESKLCLTKIYEILVNTVNSYETLLNEQNTQLETLTDILNSRDRELALTKKQLDDQTVILEEDEDFAPSCHPGGGGPPRVGSSQILPIASSAAPRSVIHQSLQQHNVSHLVASSCAIPERPTIGGGGGTLPYPYARILQDSEKAKQYSTLVLHYTEGGPVSLEFLNSMCTKDQPALRRYAIAHDKSRGEYVVIQTWIKRKSAIGSKSFTLNGLIPLAALPARKSTASAYEYVEGLPGSIKWGETTSVSDIENEK